MDTHKLIILVILSDLIFGAVAVLQATDSINAALNTRYGEQAVANDKLAADPDAAWGAQNEGIQEPGMFGWNGIAGGVLIIGSIIIALVTGAIGMIVYMLGYIANSNNPAIYQLLAFGVLIYYVILHLFVYLEADAIFRRKKNS